MGVDVNLDGGVHADDSQTANDLGRVGHLLAAQQQLVVVSFPVVVEALEAVGREADRCGRGEVETARVEEIQESILNNLGPDLEVLKVGLVEATNDGVGHVANTRLKRQQRLGETAVGHLVLEELNQVAGDLARGLIGFRVGGSRIAVVGLDDADNLVRVHGDRVGANAVLDGVDQVGLPPGREIGHGDVVETVEGGNSSVDFDNDLSERPVSLVASYN